MKRWLGSVLAVTMAVTLLAGCSTKPVEEQTNTQAVEDRLVSNAETGISFEIPQAWVDAGAMLLPDSSLSYDGEIYAEIGYSYAPNANVNELNNLESDIAVADLTSSVFKVIVVRNANVDTDSVIEMEKKYKNMQEIGKAGDFTATVLWDAVYEPTQFSKDDFKTYKALIESMPNLIESIKFTTPDEASVLQKIEENNQYLIFSSKTLSGETVEATVFHDYDLTVVNFWASYCYPSINELEQLESFYQELKVKYPKVNLIQVVIDTPDESAEAIVAKAYEEAGVTFTGVTVDTNLAKWAVNNLQGLPTTVFVDATGKIMDTKMEGVNETSAYMETTEMILGGIFAN